MARRKRAGQRAGPSDAELLAWYDRYRRKLPWRALPGETPDPYRVWLSEIADADLRDALARLGAAIKQS